MGRTILCQQLSVTSTPSRVEGSLPKISTLEGRVGDQARFPYILGHAVFDFIEAEYGEAHVRQFLFELRRYASDGTDDLYQSAFHLTPDELNQAHS